MTQRKWNPPGIADPVYRYSHAVETTGATRWLHLSGQVGLRPDRSLPDDLDGQLWQCLANIDTALADAGMTRGDIVKLTFFLTQNTPQAVATYRRIRDEWVCSAPPPAATLVIVAGLAGAGLLCEIDAVAAA
jgi:enamine deaminase RidA (YjgF/YER057c/UK114 family)